ncbi:DUF6153 family protein [Streptomyces sp. IBSBF 3136]|uniref:DUF6153 family protein n=1 Tax=Streptomyces sp. IBSBF 3136 TaxID=2903524 RepID=UPI002FDC5705
MRGSTPARQPGITRLWAVCALLFGLFLMHGAPATAAGGCHGAMGMAVTADVSHTVPAMSERTTPPRPDAARPQAAGPGASHSGTLCVAVPAPGGIPVPLAPLVGVIALAALAARGLRWAWDPDGTRRRGPPSGRRLLLQVCVART